MMMTLITRETTAQIYDIQMVICHAIIQPNIYCPFSNCSGILWADRIRNTAYTLCLKNLIRAIMNMT